MLCRRTHCARRRLHATSDGKLHHTVNQPLLSILTFNHWQFHLGYSFHFIIFFKQSVTRFQSTRRSTDVIRTLTSFHSSNCNSKLQLCNDCSHFSTHKMPDSGFGCGYRNLQMMLSCLSANPTFQTKVFQGQGCSFTPPQFCSFTSI